MKVIILQTSDIHGAIFPVDYATNRSAQIGLGKIATCIKKEQATNENIILIENGDLIQGTPLMYHYATFQKELPNPMIIVANELEYDGAVFGNHEFNYGQEVLQKAIDESSFPWLAANLLNKDGEPFYGTPYFIKEYENGLKIGVLGLTTHYIPHWEEPKHIEGIVFEDVVIAAKKWVPFLREKVDVVIVAYHGGFERDLKTGEPIERLTGENQGYRLCMEVPGIDVLLTGHQHRYIAGEKVNGVVVVQPGSSGIFVGKVTLDFEKREGRWECVDKYSELLSMEDVEVDQDILSKAWIYESATQGWLDTPLGKIEGDMSITNAAEVRLQDHPFIEFINTVQMEAAGVDISCTALLHNGSLGFPENVAMRDVLGNYIYPNTLKVIRITGEDMKAGLEQSASYFDAYDGEKMAVNPAFLHPKAQHYNYDMWEGIEYEINISQPAGSRITKLLYKGAPINPAEQYQVVMNNYRASGGGNYFMYQDKPVMKEVSIDMSELIANYILKRKVVKASVNHNWRVTHR